MNMKSDSAMRPKILVTVDVVLLTVDLESSLSDGLRVGLIRRDAAPYKGALALPGGYVHPEEDENTAAAACRVLKTKAGKAVRYLEQLATFSGPSRDPRGWSVSVCYVALEDRETMKQWPADLLARVDALPPLAFDHATLIGAAVERLRNKASYSALPVFLLPDTFTLSELQDLYGRLLGTPLDKSSFRRKVRELGFVEEVPGAFKGGQNRPAQLYRAKEMTTFDRTI
ncbi:NUDIX hydrolase [uncultured Thiodictyon sp.]|uniref:NUDIX hydrolase n=1 Tax=uncultured Thiodictyon sp. TaxID=1846217 RepID=UPI0025CC977F|nr:NUDIX hydrolase [uncultured Thiodictyon sp.]